MSQRGDPFTDETRIEYSLSEGISSASIFIYNMIGEQIAEHQMNQFGSGELLILGGELDPGLYLYSLVADGQLIGTKQMSGVALVLSVLLIGYNNRL